MPSFGGISIFGAAVSMATADIKRQSQVNSFFGSTAWNCSTAASGGRVTRVRGVLYGASTLGLAGAENLFRSLNDGATRTLVDSLGMAWTNVRMQSFQPHGRVRQAPDGTFFRAYQAQFLHLA